MGTGKGSTKQIIMYLLHSVSLTFFRPARIYYLVTVLSISCLSRKYKMTPKPVLMTDWLEKVTDGESGTVIHPPAALSTLRYETVRSSIVILFKN